MEVLFWLFAGKILYVIIQAIYVNLYKALKKQNIYFWNLVIVTVANILIIYLLFLFIRTSVAFAIGTMISNGLWFVLCVSDLKEFRPTINEYFYILVMIVILLFCGITSSFITTIANKNADIKYIINPIMAFIFIPQNSKITIITRI